MPRLTAQRRILVLALLGSMVAAAARADTTDSSWRQYATPEDAGFDSAKLGEVRTLAEQRQSAAVFVVYRGHVLLAWGDIERPFKCHSVRKSLLSALYGPYVADGTIDLNKTLAEIGIDDEPPLTDEEKKARVVDLISARSGIYHPAAYEPRDMRAERPDRGSHEPGSYFFYNNWDFNTAGVIFEKFTGRGIFEAFKEKIAEPIEMEDFTLDHTFYQCEPCSSKHPAYLFRLSARDLARVGQLFLQDGEWNGRQVVPASWVKESTTMRSNGRDGYGYMWWVYPKGMPGDMAPELSQYDHKFAASGTGSQYMMVIPGAELVFVNRGDTDAVQDGPRVPGIRMVEMILSAKTGPPKDDPKLGPVKSIPFANAVPPPPKHTEVKVDRKVFDGYLGVYESPPQFYVTMHKHGDRLFALARGEGEVELFPFSTTSFFSKAVNLQITFEKDADGKVTHANAMFFRQPMRLEKTE